MTDNRIHHKMRLALTHFESAPHWSYRAVTADDSRLLADLMYEAYLGTIDDEGESREETLAEVQRTLEGEHGPLLLSCSYLIEEGGRALSATLVSEWDGAPLVAFVMTHPDAKNSGLGTYLIQQSANALVAAGWNELFLFVTEGNAPAQHLYEKLGFVVVS